MSAVVAVGVFDGLHLGHDAILERAIRAARENSLRTVVVTFDPHPDVVLARSFRVILPLTPIPEKRERLRARGVDHLEVIPFTRELAGLAPVTFVREHLLMPFGMKRLVFGEGFALGKGRAGDAARLTAIGESLGFGVEPVPLLTGDGSVISSTRIRELLTSGQVGPAARLLGRPYDLSGRVVPGEAIGRTLGYPTANLRLHEEKFLPADGVYAGRVRIDGGARALPAAVSLGTRPTFEGGSHAIEAFLIDWDGDLSGHELTIEFVDWIRGQERFEGGEPLRAAIARDVTQVRERLAADRSGSETPSA